MASVMGFEAKSIKGFRSKEPEMLQQASLCYRKRKVGFLSDDAGGGLPVIEIEERYREKWEEAIVYLKNHLYDGNEHVDGAELFYFLLIIKEWERIFRDKLEKGFTHFAVVEEIDTANGYRTGAYKVYAAHSRDELEATPALKAVMNQQQPGIKWKKSIFSSLEELDFN